MGTDLQNGHHPVLKLTQEAYEALRNYAKAHPKRYLDPGMDFEAVLTSMGIAGYAEDTGIRSFAPIDLNPPGQGPGHRADRQAIEFYSNFRGMTPENATEGLTWAWMTHFRLHAYTLERWRANATPACTSTSPPTGS